MHGQAASRAARRRCPLFRHRRGRVHGHVRPRLVDDQRHAQRHAQLLASSPFGSANPRTTLPTGSGSAATARTASASAATRRASSASRSRIAPLAARAAARSCGVGLDDRRRPALDRHGDPLQRGVLGARRARPARAAARARSLDCQSSPPSAGPGYRDASPHPTPACARQAAQLGRRHGRDAASRTARRPAARARTASPASNVRSTRVSPPAAGSRRRDNGPAGAGVDDQPAAHRLAVAQPQLVRRQRAAAGDEARAHRLAGRRREHAPARAPRGDHRCDAAGAGHLGGHAPSSACRPSPRRRRGAPTSSSASRRWSRTSRISSAPGAPRVAVVQPVGVGQQHEQPGAQHQRDLGGQRVVVAERDLVGGRRVVLVDDRHACPSAAASRACAARSGSSCGGARRPPSAAPGRAAPAVTASARCHAPASSAWPTAEAGLQVGQPSRRAARPQRSQAERDRARADQRDGNALVGQRGEVAGDAGERPRAAPARARRPASPTRP